MRENLKHYIEFSKTREVRGLRILLEYFYAMEVFDKILRDKVRIVSVFGSARTGANDREYRMAYELGGLLYRSGFAVVTGASRGIMEAANQGVADEIARDLVRKKSAPSLEAARMSHKYKALLSRHSVGLSISLPREASANPYVGVQATFHYFMVRKFFFGTLSSAFVACEGGWGTRDELYEILTLVQTGKSPLMPIIYLAKDHRHLALDLEHTAKRKYISKDDLALIHFAKTPAQAARLIQQFYRVVDHIQYDPGDVIRIRLKSPVPAGRRKKVEALLQGGDKKGFLIQWRPRELMLHQYAPSSYGRLRRAVDEINR